jgi:1-deoxy-D-xylulose 5-phosphate reductoisomerase
VESYPFKHLKGWKASEDALLIAGLNSANEASKRRFLTAEVGRNLLSVPCRV